MNTDALYGIVGKVGLKKFFVVFSISFYVSSSFCQFEFREDNIRFLFGVKANIGSHKLTAGPFAQIQIGHNSWLNKTEVSFEFITKDFGPTDRFLEFKFASSVFYLFNKFENALQDNPTRYNLYIDDLSSKASLGYSFSWFRNVIGTSQTVGAIAVRFRNISLLFQNDLLANVSGKDRFRTGAIAVGYVAARDAFWLKSLLWTGESNCAGQVLITDSDYNSRYGYKDISKCPFGKLSHGVLAIEYERDFIQGYNIHASIGLDNERIRNLLQNKIFHDLYFLPEKIVESKNPHLPMLDIYGYPFLRNKEQVLKQSNAFLNLGYNSTGMY